jgi:hypothetical protein
MDRDKAELIYWVLQRRDYFYNYFDQDRSDYENIKKARVTIATRCRELAKTNSLPIADTNSTIEWLMSL